LERYGIKNDMARIIGIKIIIVTIKDRFKPILWITLIRLRSKKIEPTIAKMIVPTGGPSRKAPVNPSISIGELMKKIAPNWIRKLIVTHFIFVRYSDFVRNKPSFNRKISAIINTALMISSSYSPKGLIPV
jgi:hypothetical protein